MAGPQQGSAGTPVHLQPAARTDIPTASKVGVHGAAACMGS